MSNTDERMKMGRRIVLIALLALLALGFVGHVLSPLSGTHHVFNNEANCAFHSSCVVPYLVQDVVKTICALALVAGLALAFSLSIKIPHPPII